MLKLLKLTINKQYYNIYIVLNYLYIVNSIKYNIANEISNEISTYNYSSTIRFINP